MIRVRRGSRIIPRRRCPHCKKLVSDVIYDMHVYQCAQVEDRSPQPPMTAPLLIPIADIGIVKALTGSAPYHDAEPCLFCGRWIRAPRRARVKYVEITTYGSVVWAPDGPAAPVPDSQGCFPVGPDCFRQFKMIAEARLRRQGLRVVR